MCGPDDPDATYYPPLETVTCMAGLPEIKPLTDGQQRMRAQRVNRQRLFLLQHNHGMPIRGRKDER